MKSLFLVAVILQLVLIGIKTDGNYNFGDIIEFPRFCIRNKTTFSHFAIYVGGDPNDGKWRDVGQGDNDIFHRTAYILKTGCRFDKLSKTRGISGDKKKNYLDHDTPDANISPDRIAERIKEKMKDCGNYGPINNNCEHTATYVRYGVAQSKQEGTRAACVLEKLQKRKEIQEVIRRDDVNNNAYCSSDAPKQGAWQPILSACLALFCCLLI